jgi:hypothetical protein
LEKKISKLIQKKQIILIKQTHIIDAMAQHRQTLQPQAGRKSGVSLRITPRLLEKKSQN